MKPHVAFQFLVVKPNEHQVTGINRLGENLGVDEILFKTAQIYDFENGSPLIPDQSKFSRYHKTKNGNWEIKNSLENHCWKMWHSCVITWDGAVVPCCFDKDASHSMGNINEMPFKEIWEGEKYRKFRQSLLSSRKEIDICKNCTEGTTVWV
jgi:radical SAM protein with 4Fe4S-binding SPASM domain